MYKAQLISLARYDDLLQGIIPTFSVAHITYRPTVVVETLNNAQSIIPTPSVIAFEIQFYANVLFQI